MSFEKDCRYHSAFNNDNYPSIASIMLLPFKNHYDHDNKAKDIIEEALNYYTRAMFAEGYIIRGNADRTLIYLFLVINECCKQCIETRDVKTASKILRDFVCKKTLPIPGDIGFPFNPHYTRPRDAVDAYLLRSYLMQLGRECVERFIRLIFINPDNPDKHYIEFGNKRFMGASLKINA